MAHATRPATIILLGTAMLASVAASGAEIYKWVGPDGVTHFTETAPPAELPGVQVLEVTEAGAAGAPARDYRSMLAVAKDIEASRLARERLRLEKQKLRLQARQARQQYSDGYADTRVYYPLYSGYPRRPHMRRYHHPLRPVPAPHQRHGFRTRHQAPQGRVYLER